MKDFNAAAASGQTLVTDRRDLSTSDLTLILNQIEGHGAMIDDDLLKLVTSIYYAGYCRGYSHGKSRRSRKS